MILICTLSLLLFILVWLMLARITLKLDTNEHAYWIKWQGVGMVQLIAKDQSPGLRFQFFFLQKDVPLSKLWSPKKAAPKKNAPKDQKKHSFSRKKRLKALQLLRSFQIKALRLNLDTDDYVVNSYLFPLFYFFDRGSYEFRINYEGDVSLHLEVENRLYRIVKALFF